MAEPWFLCLSTFQCDHKGATESEVGPSRRDHRCPSLANTGVVASTSGNDCRNSHPPSKHNFLPLSFPSSGDKTQIATKDAFDAMQGIREKFITLGYSSDASHLLMSSWREPTQKAYNTYVAKWNQYASQHQIAVSAPKLPDVINFLTDLFKNGASYSAINTTRSALSAFLPHTHTIRTCWCSPWCLSTAEGGVWTETSSTQNTRTHGTQTKCWITWTLCLLFKTYLPKSWPSERPHYYHC